MWKKSQNKLNETFSPEKFEIKAIEISVLLLGSWEIQYVTWMLANLNTFCYIPKMYREWDSEHW